MGIHIPYWRGHQETASRASQHLNIVTPKQIDKIWLVVWNMNFIFPYIGNVIIPIDELIFFRGVGIPPTSHIFVLLGDCNNQFSGWKVHQLFSRRVHELPKHSKHLWFFVFFLPQLKDVMWECGYNNNNPPSWEWFITPISGDDWGWFVTLSYPHYRDSSFVLWHSVNLPWWLRSTKATTPCRIISCKTILSLSLGELVETGTPIRSIRIIPWAALFGKLVPPRSAAFQPTEWFLMIKTPSIYLYQYVYIRIIYI